MKVLLLADLQLEAGLSLGHGEYGPGSRFHDQEHILEQIANIADAEQVELVILAGDTFDRPKPSPWAILAMQRFLARMPKVLILTGNHDVKSLALPGVLNCLKGPDVTIAADAQTVTYGPELTVAALPWMPVSAFAAEGAPTDRDELNAFAGMKLGELAMSLTKLWKPSDTRRNILIAHWCVSGASTSAGVGVEVFREPIIPLEALTGLGFDMVALGHLHKIQVLNQTPPVLYLGSPMVHTFGDAGEPHGVWLYSTDEPEMRFVPVEDRPFYTIDWQDPETTDIPIAGQDLRNAVIRLRYEVTEDQARLVDQNSMRASILAAGASKVFIQPTIIKQTRARVAEVDTDLSPARAVEAYLDTTDGDPEQATRARALHDEYAARL